MSTKETNTSFRSWFDSVDRRITGWMAAHGIAVLRIGLGIVFFWFGALKLFPGLSPAEDLVRSTIPFIDPDVFQFVLAIWEMGIGIGLVFGIYLRLTLLLLFAQMAGTLLPLFVLPQAVWKVFPIGPTLEGQYIIKNLVLIGAGIVIGGTVRGGRLNPEP